MVCVQPFVVNFVALLSFSMELLELPALAMATVAKWSAYTTRLPRAIQLTVCGNVVRICRRPISLSVAGRLPYRAQPGFV